MGFMRDMRRVAVSELRWGVGKATQIKEGRKDFLNKEPVLKTLCIHNPWQIRSLKFMQKVKMPGQLHRRGKPFVRILLFFSRNPMMVGKGRRKSHKRERSGIRPMAG